MDGTPLGTFMSWMTMNQENTNPADANDSEADASTSSAEAHELTAAQEKKRRGTGKVRGARVPRAKGGKHRRGESRHSKEKIAAVEENHFKALEYRKRGYSYQQIGASMGVTAQTAWNWIESALKRTIQEPADDVRKLELERIDSMWVKPFEAAMGGDVMAITTCLNLMKRRAQLLGIDAPTKIRLPVPSGADGNGDEAQGVLVVGAAMTMDQWAEVAKAQQAALTTDSDNSKS